MNMRVFALLTATVLLSSRLAAQNAEPTAASSSELKLWARMTFEEEGLDFIDHNQLGVRFPIMKGNEKAGSYIALRHYPGNGVKSSLKKLAFATPGCGGFGRAIMPGKFQGKEISGGELLLLIDHIGDMPSSPDLMFAFKLYAPEDSVAYRFGFWNYTQQGKKADLLLKPKAGQWNFIRIPLHVPKSIDLGDIVRNLCLNSKSSQPFRWKVDDIVVWSGKDAEPPTVVSNMTVTAKGNDNLLTWEPSSDNLAVAQYEIHRGTVQDFTPSPKTVIGKTTDCRYLDVFPMHEDSFYRVIAIDYADNPSAPSSAAQRTQKN